MMQQKYFRSDVVHINIKEISPALLKELKEFLRLNAIRPGATEDGDSGDTGQCYFSGFFPKEVAEEIERWLRERGFSLAERVPD